MNKPRTAAQRKAAAARCRSWRKRNPEKARAAAARYLATHPPTPERLARKAALAKVWREQNLDHVKRSQAKRWLKQRDEINARRRAKRAEQPALDRARIAAWKAAHPEHSREFYRRHREKFTGGGPWASRAKSLKRAWRKFTTTGAASRSRLSTLGDSR